MTNQIAQTQPATETYTFLFRKENKNFNYDNVFYANVELAAGLDCFEAIAAALAKGAITKGSHRSGTFEVQCDRGIWVQTKARKINAARPSLVRWASWEDMEADEEAGGTGFAVDCGVAMG